MNGTGLGGGIDVLMENEQNSRFQIEKNYTCSALISDGIKSK